LCISEFNILKVHLISSLFNVKFPTLLFFFQIPKFFILILYFLDTQEAIGRAKQGQNGWFETG